MLYVRGEEEVHWLNVVWVASFLLFEHILILKLVDLKITPTTTFTFYLKIINRLLLPNWTAVDIMSSKVEDEHVTSCTDELNNMHITSTEVVDICANCGKDGGNGLKACTACKLVKYCNRNCQIAHRSKHKKACRKRASALHDIELFKQLPPNEDCPICLLPLPLLGSGIVYKSCCGKIICCGCDNSPVYCHTTDLQLGTEVSTPLHASSPMCGRSATLPPAIKLHTPRSPWYRRYVWSSSPI